MITLSKRVMSPKNILNNVVTATEVELTLLKKAQAFFMAACRSTVGYKQLMAYITVSIQVEIREKIIETTKPKVVIADKFKVNRRRVYDTTNPALRKQEVLESTFVVPEEDPSWLPDESPVVPKPVVKSTNIPVDEWELKTYINETQEFVINLNRFMNKVAAKLYAHNTLNQTQVDRHIKDVWSNWKDKVHPEHKLAAKQFCIEVHNSFSCKLSDNSTTYISTEDYLTSYFKEARRRCEEMV